MFHTLPNSIRDRDLKAKGDITGHLERRRGWDRYIWFYICSSQTSVRTLSKFGSYHMSKKISSPPLSLVGVSPCTTSMVRAKSKSNPYVQVQGVHIKQYSRNNNNTNIIWKGIPFCGLGWTSCFTFILTNTFIISLQALIKHLTYCIHPVRNIMLYLTTQLCCCALNTLRWRWKKSIFVSVRVTWKFHNNFMYVYHTP